MWAMRQFVNERFSTPAPISAPSCTFAAAWALATPVGPNRNAVYSKPMPSNETSRTTSPRARSPANTTSDVATGTCARVRSTVSPSRGM